MLAALSFLRSAVNQKVRIHNIAFRGPKDGSGPKQIKLFINRHSFGFSDVDSVPCAQQLELTAKDLDGEPIALKLTKVWQQAAAAAAGATWIVLLYTHAARGGMFKCLCCVCESCIHMSATGLVRSDATGCRMA